MAKYKSILTKMKSFPNSHTHCQAAQTNAKPKLGKECVCLNARPKRPTNQRMKKNTERTTSCIVHLADSANFEGITSNKLCDGLTGSCFESPNDTIHVTVVANVRKAENEI